MGGVVDCPGNNPFFLPDPEELGEHDDLVIHHFVDYGDGLMRGTKPIQKYQGFANVMGERITINSQTTVGSFEIDLVNGARMIYFAANDFVRK